LPGPEQPEKKTGLIATYREFLTSKAFWSVVLTFGLMNGVYSAMITHLPTYLTSERHFDLYQASYVLGVAGAFAIGGKVVLGWMMDHLNAKTTVLSAVSAYVLSTLIFIWAESYSLLLLAAGLFGLGFGGMVPVRSVILSRLFGAGKFSRVNGLLSFFLAPATFWVLITGYVADTTGTYVTAFKVWAVAFVLAGCVTALIRLPNREDAVA
jgi:MFS family permease